MYITKSVYRIDATKGSYAYALKTEEGIILVDTSFSMPGRIEKMLEELKREGLDQIKNILITHHDIDHFGNATFFQKKYNCNVYMSEADLPYVIGQKKRGGIKNILGKIMRAEAPSNIQIFSDDELFGIQLLPSPGHTPGHTSFLFDGVLLAGDVVSTKKGEIVAPPAMMTADMDQNMKSVKLLAKATFEWVCPAHGQPVKTSVMGKNW